MLLADDWDFLSDSTAVLPDLEQEEVFRILTDFEDLESESVTDLSFLDKDTEHFLDQFIREAYFDTYTFPPFAGFETPIEEQHYSEVPRFASTPPPVAEEESAFSFYPSLNAQPLLQQTTDGPYLKSVLQSYPRVSSPEYLEWTPEGNESFQSNLSYVQPLPAFQRYEQRTPEHHYPPIKKEEAPVQLLQYLELTAPNAIVTPPSGVPGTVQFSFQPLNGKNARSSVISYGVAPQQPSMPSLDWEDEDDEEPRLIIDWPDKTEFPITPPQSSAALSSIPSLASPLEDEDDDEPRLVIDWPDRSEFPITPPRSSPALSDEEFDVVGLSPLKKKFYPNPVVIPGHPLPAIHRYPFQPDVPAEPVPEVPKVPEVPEAPQPAKKLRIGELYSHLVSEILQDDNPIEERMEPSPKRSKVGRKKLIRPPTVPGQFYCAPCDKNFMLSRSLKQHENAHHSGPRPFRCDECGKRYPEEAQLREHLKVHMDMDKPFWCNEDGCGRRFLTRQSLERHFLVIHAKGGLECKLCPRRFARNDHLLNHIASHMIGTVKKVR